LRTPVCDQFGIEFPLFAFSHCRDVVAAVSRAGGFGVLGALAFTPEELEIELAWIDEHVEGKPYGVDLVMPANYVGKGGVQPSAEELRAMIPAEYWEFTDKILSEFGVPRSRTTTTSARGQPDSASTTRPPRGRDRPQARARQAPGQRARPAAEEVVDKAHEHGILVAALVGSKHHAQKQVDIGVDVVVAQAPRPVATPATSPRWCSFPRSSTRSVPTCRSSRPAASARPSDGGRVGFGRARRLDRLDLAHRRRGGHPGEAASRTFSPPTRARRCGPAR